MVVRNLGLDEDEYFEDLTEVHKWNWGAVVLVYLQNYMEASTKWHCGQMAGYMSLLQGWILSHCPRISVARG
ncbi:hypothetical protein QL285_014121 [Trifolium repens]|nr:hypothetical protein QL285_014121 [Trifolium repens]